MVILETTEGNIEINLFADKAPKTVENFLGYVEDGFFNDKIFHRVIKGFMIQGGGMNEAMEEQPTKDPIENEADNGLSNKKYTLAMARTQIPDSASSQFFINTADNVFLDFKSKTMDGWGYCVFAEVTKGQEIVDKIETIATTTKGGHADVPIEAITITGAKVS